MRTYSLRPGLAALAALPLLFLAACQGDGGITAAPPAVTPPATVAAIQCSAEPRSGRVSCDQAGAAGLRGDRVIGGQRVNVLVSSSNVSYDSVSHEFAFDVTVKNLLIQRMGSDGVNVSGVKVFFAQAPTATSGAGTLTVKNADGVDLFTGSGQPYFSYPGGLAPGATTAPRTWRLDVPPSVGSFAFTLYISTPLVPVVVAEMTVAGNRDLYRMGIDGNDVLRLSTSLLTDGNPTVAQGRVVFTSYRDGNAELYSVPLAGGAETRLTNSAGLSETNPALSPDGSRLAWASGPNGGITQVWVGNASAGSASAAAPGFVSSIQTSPNWKDNASLVFTMAYASSADLYLVTPPAVAVLGHGTSSAEVEPAWSPDGSAIAFASNRSGDTELYLYSVAGGAVTRLTTRTGSDGAPTWLADGRIVFTCVSGTVFHLCLVDPASPGVITTLNTPYPADHAAAVRY
jgi:hypothetical protein